MKKVLVIAYGEFYPFSGGIASYTESIIQSLKKKAEITVLTHYDKSFTSYPDKSVTVVRPRLSSIGFIRKTVGNIYTNYIYNKVQPDYVIITHPEALLLSQQVLDLGNKDQFSYVIYGTEIQDIAEGMGVMDKKKFIQSLKKVKNIISISKFTSKLFREYFPKLHESQLLLLYPTVTKSFLKAEPTGISIQSRYFLSIGRLVKRKGHDTVIKLMPEILKQYPAIQYVIIGDGPEKQNLKKLAMDLEVKENVIFTGKISEGFKKGLIRDSLFYIHPSVSVSETHQRVEGFGIAILEALSLGKPCIIYNNGGMKEIIKNGENGFIIQENDIEQLLKAMKQIIQNKKVRTIFNKNTTWSYKTKFNPTIFADNLCQILKI